ncbi:MAG: ribosome biogenesis GTP-binding protein YihA/YsxC [Bacteroidales bacterium]|jgi:GTP-binding protein|nr:YihA family ribosome biogenesis GTP-binding protein [Bacteroidales bacterium]MEE0936891.1 ribosome biogenesis GTP-binding protein YihA/YsxC [Bacteroidales bacterium]MEE1190710.1 ribosome biogenesis GTP-binding protein YihA/YsxC [Bacteroidales bacterium]
MIVSSAEFVKSSQELNQCPQPDMPEFAFIGRSNVGKSSLINMLVEKKDLAKTSSQPGKTQLINHFIINKEWYLVDLPGYGYAKTSMENRKKWRKMIEDYLLKRVNLLTVFVLVDSRLEPQKIDLEFINFLGENQVPITLIFTKTDKQSAKKTEESLERFKESLSEYWEELPEIILTSSEKRVGRDEVLETIENIIPFFNQENE